MLLTLSIDCVREHPISQMGIQQSFLPMARQVLRIAREHNRMLSSLSKPREIAALMSAAMTFLSSMSDTAYGFLRVTVTMVSADRGLGGTGHDLFVKVSDITPKWFLPRC
jgi:hypothetical protein